MSWFQRMKDALDECEMFSNPQTFDQAADHIDCCKSGCDYVRHEYDVGASWCRASGRGEYCPNDLAETLRAIARVARAFEKEKERQ